MTSLKIYILLEPKMIPHHLLQGWVEPNMTPLRWIQEQAIPKNHQIWHHIKDKGIT